MQIVIDISEEDYEIIKNTTFTENTETIFRQSSEDRKGTMMLFRLLDSVTDGTSLPEEATNGDIIKAMFPDAEYKIIRKLSGCDYIEVKLDNINRHQFELDWWNAPYKRGED